MRTLHRSVSRGVAAGEPLPAPWPIMQQQRALIRRGGLSMVAGPPGSMKTMFLLNVVRNMDGIPTLYLSSDSDDHTMASRVLSMLAGEPSEETEKWLKTRKDHASKLLKDMQHVKWCFDAAPTIERIWSEMDAAAEVTGQYPPLTVLDILMDVDYDGVSEQNYWRLMAELKIIARETQTALVIAHHTSESVKGEPCPPRSAIMGKANQLPVLILTLAADPLSGILQFAVVKNRYGPGDITGRTAHQLKVVGDLCRIESAPQQADVPIKFRDGPWTPPHLKKKEEGEAE